MKKDILYEFLCAFACAGLSVILFFGTLENQAIYDDFHCILTNKDVRTDRTPISSLLYDDFWGSGINSNTSNTQWRPLTVLTYRIDYDIGNCSNSPLISKSPCLKQFRITDLLLHSLTSSLVFVITRTLFSLDLKSSLFVSMLFSVHPIHIESISTLYGRADILCSVFQITSLFLAPLSPTLSILFAISSSLTKETGLASLALIPLCHWLKSNKRFPSFLLSLVCFALILSTFVARKTLITSWTPPTGYQDNPYAFLPPNPLLKALSYAHIHSRYLFWLFFPLIHAPNYGFNSIPPIMSLSDPRNLFTLLAYSILFIAFLVMLLRKAWKELLLLIWGVAVFLPASNVLFPVGTAFADRLLYIPSIPFCILIGCLLSNLLSRLEGKSKINLGITYFCVILIALIASITYSRIPDWKTSESIWESTTKQIPNNVVATHNLAVERQKDGRLQEAIYLYEHVANLLEHSEYKLAYEDPLGPKSRLLANSLKESLERQRQLVKDPKSAIELAKWCGEQFSDNKNGKLNENIAIVDNALKDILMSGSLKEIAPDADDSVLRAVIELHLKTGRARDLYYILLSVLKNRKQSSPCITTIRSILPLVEKAADSSV